MSKRMLNRKRKRELEESKKIELKIGRKNENFDLISHRLNKADELFIKYKEAKEDEKRWEIIKQVIEQVEINPKFNKEFLKLNHNFNENDYEYDYNQLSPTLSGRDYSFLFNKKQKNPSKILFDLLCLYLEDEEKFEIETKKIINNKYNIPLIEGNERLRMNYYLQLFSHYENLLTNKQKIYLLNPEQNISKTEQEKITSLQNKYDNIKIGIKFFGKLIPRMENYFMGINLEDNDFNIKIFTFILYLTDVIRRIRLSGNNRTFILKFFEKEIEPTKELKENDSLENILSSEENFSIPIGYGIKKVYNNNIIKNNDINKDRKINSYSIYNEFEAIEFDGRNYVLENLLLDYKENPYIPLDILLLRNQSLSFFINNNKNFLNVNDNIFNEFKEYFKMFIKSKCMKEALNKDSKYINIIRLINDDNIINKFLNEKYLKSIPLFEFAGSGYTNKDILVSCISGLPFIIHRYNVAQTKKEYTQLRSLIVLFNIGMKFITTVHELIIHLCFACLNYITEGKISYESPRKRNKIIFDDGGLYFEHLLFGREYGNITLKDVLVILNCDSFDSLKNFQADLRNEMNYENFKVKSKLLKLIFEEYKITLNHLKNNKKVYSTMKSSESQMHIKRDIMNILLPYKAPIAYSYYA